MSTPRSVPPIRRPALWLLALALVACGDAGEGAVQEAQQKLERGELEDAGRLLDGLDGQLAADLRAKLAAAASRREAVQRSLQTIRDGASEHEDSWARLQLADLMAGEHDPANLKLIEQAQKETTTRSAANRRAGGRGEPRADAGALAKESLAEARKAQVQKDWKAALQLASEAEADPSSAAGARKLRESILSAAQVEAEALIAHAREVEDFAGPAEASLVLVKEVARFPKTQEFDALRSQLERLAAGGARGDPVQQSSASTPTRRAPNVAGAPAGDAALARADTPFTCAAIAESRASQGDFSGARDAWLESARRKPESPWRDECERRARECDVRLALREELADFARIDGETAKLLGWKAAADGLGAPKFETIPLANLSQAIERAHVSRKARLGWLVESITRGDGGERALVLDELGACVERQELDPEHASRLVAKAKGEIAAGGWVFQGGHWIEGLVARSESAALADSARNAKYAALLGAFQRSAGAERDALLEQIRAVGDPELVSKALVLRWQDAWEKLERNPNLRQLAALADDRRALDAAREKALNLIFDEERYFYPYNPPECPPQKAAKYAAVQREVDELVNAVHDVWEGSKEVKIGEILRQELVAMEWNAARAEELHVELPPVPSEWRFALVLPETGNVGLRQFAWDAAERTEIALCERIEARNERLWAALARAKPADDVPNEEEEQQVRVTNEYRRMLGRRALAWNPKIEAAAQGHSNHMANTGEFSHDETGDPARHSPFDRLRLAGYPKGVSENISMGHGDPKSAHEGWTHSSGHHRNLLMRTHREMASAIASSYWTQNFGVDDSFLTDL